MLVYNYNALFNGPCLQKFICVRGLCVNLNTLQVYLPRFGVLCTEEMDFRNFCEEILLNTV